MTRNAFFDLRHVSLVTFVLAAVGTACSSGTDGSGSPNSVPGAGGVPGANTGALPGAMGGATAAGGQNAIPGAGGSGPAAGGTAPIVGTDPGPTRSSTGGAGPLPGAGGASNGGAAAGGASSAGGATGVAGSAGAAGSNGMGCGQGTFCQPADDLAPPDAADGFQIVSPSSITLTPGQEQFLCYYKDVPGAVTVGGFRSWMTKGASHHFIVFQGSGGVDGSLQSCAFGSGAWIYATSKSGLMVGMDMPPSVGLPFNSGTSLVLNMHLVNNSGDIAKPVVKLNVLFAKDAKYSAAAAYSALSPNLSINIPPLGTQTVRGTCTVPTGSKFFLWTTHTHKYATNVDINYVSGGQTTRIVQTTDWENPGTRTWGPTDFLTTKAGDSFQYACSYKNPNPVAVTFGETAASNEMCMAIGYFFPAGPYSCR